MRGVYFSLWQREEKSKPRAEMTNQEKERKSTRNRRIEKKANVPKHF
jgi:inosine/xanthosine triphosphate pyrophosphatase family protein